MTADNVEFVQADLLGFQAEPFDHVFVCFVLEHLRDPYAALRRLKALLKPGGTITVIEGDHGSAYFHPESEAADDAIACLVSCRAATRRSGAGSIRSCSAPASPAHRSHRGWSTSTRASRGSSEAFTRKTFTAMVEGVREAALTAGLIDADRFDQGVADLAATETFSYTFFKAVASRG